MSFLEGATGTINDALSEASSVLSNTITDSLTEASAALSLKSIIKAFQLLAVTLNYTVQTFSDYKPTNNEHFDFIIVGGGTAGLVLANRLTEIPDFNVAVIEAGGDPPLDSVIPGMFPFTTHSNVDWDYYAQEVPIISQSLNKNRVMYTDGKVLGGASSINHLLYVRGYKPDFNEWAKKGFKDWEWKRVLKYFKKSERMLDKRILDGPTAKYHSADGLLSVNAQTVNSGFLATEKRLFDIFDEIGIRRTFDLNTPIANGTAYINTLTNENGRRSSTAETYLLPVKDRANLFIIKNTMAIKILFDDNHASKAIGVKVQSSVGTLNLYADNEVILSAGVFNTPQLLLLSGIGPSDHLNELAIPVVKDLPVGYNLQDHLTIPLVIAGKKSPITTLDTLLSLLDMGTLPLPIVAGPFSANKTFADVEHITVKFGASSPLFLYIISVNFNYGFKFTISHLLNHPARELFVSLVSLLKPKSTGRVSLKSTNPNDPPLIETGFLTEEEDLDQIVAGLKKVYTIQDTTYFTQNGGKFSKPNLPPCDDYGFPSDEYWICYAKTLAGTDYHTVGSCPMGKVVDGKLKVKGIDNLRIVDASVMPSVPRGEPEAATIMIAEMAADFIKAEYCDNDEK